MKANSVTPQTSLTGAEVEEELLCWTFLYTSNTARHVPDRIKRCTFLTYCHILQTFLTACAILCFASWWGGMNVG